MCLVGGERKMMITPRCFLIGPPKSFLFKIGRKLHGKIGWLMTNMACTLLFFFSFFFFSNSSYNKCLPFVLLGLVQPSFQGFGFSVSLCVFHTDDLFIISIAKLPFSSSAASFRVSSDSLFYF